MPHCQAQSLPSFKLVLPTDHHQTILPNLSYPSRPHSHISWSRSLGPLRFAKHLDVRSRPTMAFSYASATATTLTTNDESHDGNSSVPHVFRGIRGLIWFIFTSKLKLLVQKLIRTGSPAPSAVVNSSV